MNGPNVRQYWISPIKRTTFPGLGQESRPCGPSTLWTTSADLQAVYTLTIWMYCAWNHKVVAWWSTWTCSGCGGLHTAATPRIFGAMETHSIRRIRRHSCKRLGLRSRCICQQWMGELCAFVTAWMWSIEQVRLRQVYVLFLSPILLQALLICTSTIVIPVSTDTANTSLDCIFFLLL